MDEHPVYKKGMMVLRPDGQKLGTVSGIYDNNVYGITASGKQHFPHYSTGLVVKDGNGANDSNPFRGYFILETDLIGPEEVTTSPPWQIFRRKTKPAVRLVVSAKTPEKWDIIEEQAKEGIEYTIIGPLTA